MAPVRFNRLAQVAAVIAAVLLLAPAAAAETVMVHRRTRVMARPTEEATTVMRVKEDRPARVLRRGGDWVKVRIGEDVGWVPRSQIDEEDSEDEQALDEETVVAAEEEQGDEAVDEDEEAGVEEDADEELPGGEEKPRLPAAPRVSAHAALGLRNLRSAFRSDGAMQLGNYRLSARSYSAGVGVDVVAYRSSPLVGIVDARYQGSVASPGVQFDTSEEGTGYIPFTTHDIDLGARVGYGFGWLRASLRAGYHADLIRVERLDNVGKMPSEVVTGFVIGAAAEVPFTGSGWSARLAYDSLVGGKRKQTSGLEDGAPGRAAAGWTTAAIGYALSRTLCAELGYRRAKWTSSWSGTSAREADVTSATRTDVAQQFTVGLAQSF